MVVVNFPTETNGVIHFMEDSAGRPAFVPPLTIRSTDQGLVLLAFLSGVTASFLHASQSLATYVGNGEFKTSWVAWYVLRPWIGGILGFAIYFVFRAGLVAGPSGVNPYGVVSIGLLGGWFSKTTTDKLQEVFDTLFKTDADKRRKNKLQEAEQPVVLEVRPPSVPAGVNELTILGQNFVKGATVTIDQAVIPADFVSDSELKVNTTALSQRPTGEVLFWSRIPKASGHNRSPSGFHFVEPFVT